MSTSQCNRSSDPSTEKCWCSTFPFHEAKYTWEINDFSILETGVLVTSPTFSAPTNKKCLWQLELSTTTLTGGNYPRSPGYVSLYLRLNHNSSLKQAFAKFVFSILNNAQEECFIADSQFHEFNNKSIANQSARRTHQGDRHGWVNFLKKDDAFYNNVLVRDTLTFSFQITFFELDDSNIAKIFHRCNANFQKLSVNFASVLENHNFADFTLSVPGKDYPVHKVILAARSNYFARMFESGMKESKQNRTEITDVNEEVLSEMLKFIYTGKCENVDKLADGLLAAADKYDLDELKKICEESISKSFSVDNAANILVSADLYHANELKLKAINFILTKPAEIKNSTAWNDIMPKYPQLLNEVCNSAFSRISGI